MTRRRGEITETEWIEELRRCIHEEPPRGAVPLAELALRLGVSRSCAQDVARRRGLTQKNFFTNGRWRTFVYRPGQGEST